VLVDVVNEDAVAVAVAVAFVELKNGNGKALTTADDGAKLSPRCINDNTTVNSSSKAVKGGAVVAAVPVVGIIVLLLLRVDVNVDCDSHLLRDTSFVLVSYIISSLLLVSVGVNLGGGIVGD
jgi:hypothetical protein